ncbi:MAG: hypothetical protein AB8B85_10915 [Paracoccaceae bacterium]
MRMEPRVLTPDELVTPDNWSRLARIRALPEIDPARMLAYRQERPQAEMQAEMQAADVALTVW